MKKISFILTMLLMTAGVFAVPGDALDRGTTRKILKRTAQVITRSTKAMQEKRVMNGNLSRAVSHQKLARILYTRKIYKKAAFHSLYARALAYTVLNTNGQRDAQEYSEEEKKIPLPPEADLNISMSAELPRETTDDGNYLEIIPYLDVND